MAVQKSFYAAARAHGQDYLALLKTRPAIGTVLNPGRLRRILKVVNQREMRYVRLFHDSEDSLKVGWGIALERHQAFGTSSYMMAVSALSLRTYRNPEGSQIRDEYLQNLLPF